MSKKVLWLAVVGLLVMLPMSSFAGDNSGDVSDMVISRSADGLRATVNIDGYHDTPNQVQRYYVECSDATNIRAQIADCCIPGDHFEVTVKTWDPAPNEAVATCPGGAGVYGVPAKAFNYGRTPMRALVEVRYLHGINSFSAGWYLRLLTNGTCEPIVTDLGLSEF